MEEKFMKKILGILVLASVCILLGLSVEWSKERNVTLVSAEQGEEISAVML